MTIHTSKLPTFALYTAYADEFGLTAFGSCQDEALNNLQDELRDREQAGLAKSGMEVGRLKLG
ncbi:MAG: hypothetical protein JJE04_21230 [Acidobacteriia bacterium]|nr:hypothetical protein [Terriglobia bacterium]